MKKTFITGTLITGLSITALFAIPESHAQHTEVTQRIKNQDSILGGLQAANDDTVLQDREHCQLSGVGKSWHSALFTRVPAGLIEYFFECDKNLPDI
jgi:hypothetical protein